MRALSRGAAVLGTTALVAGLAAAPAGAATPEASTLKAPKKSGTVVSQWSGTLAAPGLGVLVATDPHALTVAIPGKAAKYLKKREAALQIEMSWVSTTPLDDLDLYVYDAAGTEVASSIAGAGVEEVRIPVTGSATYTVEVQGFISTPGQAYDAQAFLVVTPSVPITCGRTVAQARC